MLADVAIVGSSRTPGEGGQHRSDQPTAGGSRLLRLEPPTSGWPRRSADGGLGHCIPTAWPDAGRTGPRHPWTRRRLEPTIRWCGWRRPGWARRQLTGGLEPCAGPTGSWTPSPPKTRRVFHASLAHDAVRHLPRKGGIDPHDHGLGDGPRQHAAPTPASRDDVEHGAVLTWLHRGSGVYGGRVQMEHTSMSRASRCRCAPTPRSSSNDCSWLAPDHTARVHPRHLRGQPVLT